MFESLPWAERTQICFIHTASIRLIEATHLSRLHQAHSYHDN